MSKVAFLAITRVGDGFRFQRGKPESGPAAFAPETTSISKDDQEQLHRAIEQATRDPSGRYQLENLGGWMSRRLLPPQIQDFLRKLDTPLIISTDAPEIPWELCYDGRTQQFLGLRCAIGRQLVTATELQAHTETPPFDEQSFLLIGNPRGDLKAAEEEIQRLRKICLSAGASMRILMGSRATSFDVQLELEKGKQYLAIHYAGHAMQDSANGPCSLLLANKTRLSSDSIQKVLRGHPIVFLNACATDRAGKPDRRNAITLKITEGLAGAFIGGGARCVIGTRWDVNDHEASDFAVLFYEAALEGQPIGEALRLARVRFRELHPDDATWAAFVLYGDPTLYLIEPSSPFLPTGRLNRACFSSGVGKALGALPNETQQTGSEVIDVQHLLLALTTIDGGRTAEVLAKMGHERAEAHSQMQRLFRRDRPPTRQLELIRDAFSDRARAALEAAKTEAKAMSAERIEEDHLLAVALRLLDKDLAEQLRQRGLDPERMLALLNGEVEGGGNGAVVADPPPPPPPPRTRPRLAPLAEVLAIASAEASYMGYPKVDTPHLVIALTKVRRGYTDLGLQEQGFIPKHVRDTIRQALPIAGPPRRSPPEITSAMLGSRVQRIINDAGNEAQSANSEDIYERQVLIAFLKTKDSSTRQFLEDLSIDLEALRAYAQQVEPSAQHEQDIAQGAWPVPQDGRGRRPTSSETPYLDQLGRDLTREAREGKLKPVIGRSQELGQIARILARADKNTPLLLGDAGVGKTAVVEGLAQRIADGTAPQNLLGKRIIDLPVANLVAGTKYRGDLEGLLAKVIREASQPEIILFLDEIHTLVGAGRAEGGMLDVGNMIKPALSDGRIRCIGATTLGEFRKSIEKDAALVRRFQAVMIAEPSPEEAREILRQTRERYERHHQVRLLDTALEAAVALSVAYLPDLRLPDKACDLVDDACARARISSASQWSAQASPLAVPPVVDAEAVARVVAEKTGIPVARLTEAEQDRLLKLEESLHRRVVGQDEAVAAVSQAVRLGRAGLKKQSRPTGVFLFIGPTGVGKTELAKALAETLFGSEQELIRLDMSEFMEPHSVARLIGAPPGYVGYEEEGQLSGALRRKPYAVVLLDEIEKAHSHVYDLFLQLFDDGRLTDAQGRLADGSNAIFILTSNVATELIRRQPVGFQTRHLAAEPDHRRVLEGELRKTFRPEFLNRIDEIVVFQPLTQEQTLAIARLQLEQLVRQLREQHGLTLIVEDIALERIAAEGYSEQYGARPLERAIERLVKQPLSNLILSGAKGTVRVIADGKIVRLARQELP